jgi:hypothetical protein
VRPEKVVSGYLYTLGIFAALTAISPLFVFSWPYLAIAGYPTVRWALRSKSPVGRTVRVWIVFVAFLMTGTPFVTLIFSALDGYSGPENWWFLGLSAVFGVFLVAAVQCLSARNRTTRDAELGSA